jgi:hypothetical protein
MGLTKREHIKRINTIMRKYGSSDPAKAYDYLNKWYEKCLGKGCQKYVLYRGAMDKSLKLLAQKRGTPARNMARKRVRR